MYRDRLDRLLDRLEDKNPDLIRRICQYAEKLDAKGREARRGEKQRPVFEEYTSNIDD